MRGPKIWGEEEPKVVRHLGWEVGRKAEGSKLLDTFFKGRRLFYSKWKSLPLVILLHGVYGSSWVWTRKGGVHISALDMIQKGIVNPMVIAMPSDGLWGDGSGYLPHNNKDFEKWIVDDVPNAVIENISSIHQTSQKAPLMFWTLAVST